jgi:hypothetical protein
MKQGTMTIKVNQTKESEAQRKERLELIGSVQTRVVPDKTKYNRNQKYKGEWE